jgi:hypothetical protein
MLLGFLASCSTVDSRIQDAPRTFESLSPCGSGAGPAREYSRTDPEISSWDTITTTGTGRFKDIAAYPLIIQSAFGVPTPSPTTKPQDATSLARVVVTGSSPLDQAAAFDVQHESLNVM